MIWKWKKNGLEAALWALENSTTPDFLLELWEHEQSFQRLRTVWTGGRPGGERNNCEKSKNVGVPGTAISVIY